MRRRTWQPLTSLPWALGAFVRLRSALDGIAEEQAAADLREHGEVCS